MYFRRWSFVTVCVVLLAVLGAFPLGSQPPGFGGIERDVIVNQSSPENPIGVGFGTWEGAEPLTINLSADPGEIGSTTMYAPEGVIWSPIDAAQPDPWIFKTTAVFPDEAFAVKFKGTYAGEGEMPVEWGVAVSQIDLDCDSTNSSIAAFRAPSHSDEEDDAEYPEGPEPGGMTVGLNSGWTMLKVNAQIKRVSTFYFLADTLGLSAFDVADDSFAILGELGTDGGDSVLAQQTVNPGDGPWIFYIKPKGEAEENDQIVVSAVLLAQGPTGAQEVGNRRVEDKVTIQALNRLNQLVIHNGLYDWVEKKSYSGGQPLHPILKLLGKGAFTVANLNDTDGDGNPDVTQDGIDGVVSTPAGRNEIDLMKLIIKQPDPDDGGKVTLRVMSGNIKLWEEPTKKIEFVMPIVLLKPTREIDTTDLPKTLWVEARSASETVNDIHLELSYKDETDSVKATAAWVEMTGFRNSQITTTLTADAAAGQDKINVDSTDGLQAGTHLIIYRDRGSTRQAVAIASISGNEITLVENLTDAYLAGDEVREGVSRNASNGFNTAISTLGGGKLGATHVSPMTRNGMEMEFSILPSGIATEEFLIWDITRQKESIGWRTNGLGGEAVTTEIKVEGIAPSDWPIEDESPNDDPADSVDDEFNTPIHGKIYCADMPGALSDAAFADRFILRFNFREFVRLQFKSAFKNEDSVIEGSRCSDRISWRSRMDVESNPVNGLWQRNGADNKIQLGHEALGGAP